MGGGVETPLLDRPIAIPALGAEVFEDMLGLKRLKFCFI